MRCTWSLAWFIVGLHGFPLELFGGTSLLALFVRISLVMLFMIMSLLKLVMVTSLVCSKGKVLWQCCLR